MNSIHRTSHQAWMMLIALWSAFAAYAITQGAGFIFGGPVIETGDFAVNAIQITHAKHFAEIYGNYSRWGFNHPGPFFFYIYAASEAFFYDLLHIVASPHQAHVLGGILLQTGFLASAIVTAASLTGRKSTVLIWVAAAAIVLPYAGSAFSSIWMPHVILAPYALLVTSCAAIACGRAAYIPVGAFVVCVLCHGHVAQPLMTIPLFSAAIYAYLRQQRTKGLPLSSVIRSNRVEIAGSIAIIVIFLAPIVLDLLRGEASNFHRIREYMGHPGASKPNISKALNYAFSYFVFDHTPENIGNMKHVPLLTKRILLGVASIGVMMFLPRLLPSDKQKGYRLLAKFIAGAMLLAILWSKQVTGPLYEFNSHFIYGIVMMTWAQIATTLLHLLAYRHEAVSELVMASAFAVITVIAVVWAPHLNVFSEPHVLALKSPYMDRDHTPAPAIIDQTTNEDWPGTTALALWLTRSGSDYRVTNDWAYVFGWSHSLDTHPAPPGSVIWAPGQVRQMLARHEFNIDDFCHMGQQTQLGSDKGLEEPNTFRRECHGTIVGIGPLSNENTSWTIYDKLFIQMPLIRTPSVLRIQATPWLADNKIKGQRLTIKVNGNVVQTTVMSVSGALDIPLQNGSVGNSPPIVEVDIHDARSPASDGLGNDDRKLGLSISGIGVFPEK